MELIVSSKTLERHLPGLPSLVQKKQDVVTLSMFMASLLEADLSSMLKTSTQRGSSALGVTAAQGPQTILSLRGKISY